MVFVDFAVLGVLVGLAAGGRFGALGALKLRSLPLVYVAVALQVAAFPSGVFPWSTPVSVARPLWLASYALLIAFIVRNRHLRGVELVALGLVSNLVAILANGGLMPAKLGALRDAGLAYDIHNNSVSSAHPHLALLVDRWAAPHWLPLANVYSVGDVLIGLGTVAVVALGMRVHEEDRVSRAVHDLNHQMAELGDRIAAVGRELGLARP